MLDVGSTEYEFRELGRRCRALLNREGTYHPSKGSGISCRSASFNDGSATLYIELYENGRLRVLLSRDQGPIYFIYSDGGPDQAPDGWHGDEVYDVAIPMLRRRMVLDDLSGV
jgi:hypothetical protein